jgi:hypothetical protein
MGGETLGFSERTVGSGREAEQLPGFGRHYSPDSTVYMDKLGVRVVLLDGVLEFAKRTVDFKRIFGIFGRSCPSPGWIFEDFY